MIGHPSLLDRAQVPDLLALDPQDEAMWIEVIRKMDAVYADLVRYQIELEEKNAALEEAQRFIRGVLGSMTDVLIVCDLEGRIQQVNRALERLAGLTEAELRGRPLASLFHGDCVAEAARFPERLGADALIDCEVSLRDREGRSAPLAMNCSSRYDHEGRLVGMVLIGRPVGELRRAYGDLARAHRELKETQRQLVHSEKMASLGRLVAGVAHELNNPISVVFGNMHALKRYGERIARYLEATGRGPCPPELTALREELRIDRILGDIGPLIEGTLEGAERVSEIVQDLRRYSTAQREPATEIDLAEVARTAVHWVLKASRVGAAVEWELAEGLVVSAPKGAVHQILVNLVQNALDVMDGRPAPVVAVSAGKEGDRVWVRVRDHGPGIPDADLAKLFDPFFTTKPVGKGTGLGLYVSYGLAEEMGGELSAGNHPEGGAEFCLRIPVAAERGR